jgi:SAM-dependent methyltransferase
MDELVTSWLAALEHRHLADLTPAEVARALRALSSCYVERRSKLEAGGALASRGKRAAFALFYGPIHFMTTSLIVRALPGALDGIRDVTDLGCGTGAAGAAWANAAGAPSIRGYDRHPWAIAEANATYRHFHLNGRASQRDIAKLAADGAERSLLRARCGSAIVAAYAANELASEGRIILLEALRRAAEQGARALVIEPIARRTAPWWGEWQHAVEGAGGRADEWRFPAELGQTQRSLARAAGLDPRELTARSLFL